MDDGGVRPYARSDRHDARRSTFPEHPWISSVAPAFVELLKRERRRKERGKRGEEERGSGKIRTRCLLLAVALCRTKQKITFKLVVGESVRTRAPVRGNFTRDRVRHWVRRLPRAI